MDVVEAWLGDSLQLERAMYPFVSASMGVKVTVKPFVVTLVSVMSKHVTTIKIAVCECFF